MLMMVKSLILAFMFALLCIWVELTETIIKDNRRLKDKDK